MQPSYRRILPRDCVEAYDTPGKGGNNWSRNRARAFGVDDDEQAAEFLAENAATTEADRVEREARIEAHRRYITRALAAIPEVSSGVRTAEEAAMVAELGRDWEGTTQTLHRARWEGL